MKILLIVSCLLIRPHGLLASQTNGGKVLWKITIRRNAHQRPQNVFWEAKQKDKSNVEVAFYKEGALQKKFLITSDDGFYFQKQVTKISLE